MSHAPAALYAGTIAPSDAAEIQALLCRSAAAFKQDADPREFAALWYQLSERLCRRGVPLDEVLTRIGHDPPPRSSVGNFGEDLSCTIHAFIRYYVVRGYQDAMKCKSLDLTYQATCEVSFVVHRVRFAFLHCG